MAESVFYLITNRLQAEREHLMDLTQNQVKLALSDIYNRFAYHAPNDLQKTLHERIRLMHKDLAINILKNLPNCREQSLAITKLEESMMWANAGIARNKSFYAGPKHDET